MLRPGVWAGKSRPAKRLTGEDHHQGQSHQHGDRMCQDRLPNEKIVPSFMTSPSSHE